MTEQKPERVLTPPLSIEIMPYREVWEALACLGSDYTLQTKSGALFSASPEAVRIVTFSRRGESSYILSLYRFLTASTSKDRLSLKQDLNKKFARAAEEWDRPFMVEAQSAYERSARELLSKKRIWSVGMILGRDVNDREVFCMFYPTAFGEIPSIPQTMLSPGKLSLFFLRSVRVNNDGLVSVNSLKGLPLV